MNNTFSYHHNSEFVESGLSLSNGRPHATLALVDKRVVTLVREVRVSAGSIQARWENLFVKGGTCVGSCGLQYRTKCTRW